MTLAHGSLSGSYGSSAIGAMFQQYRPLLRRLVASRLDRRLAGRVDPSDIVQETLVEAFRRIRSEQWPRTDSIIPWLTKLATQNVIIAHRRHLLTQKRSVSCEQEIKSSSDSAAPHNMVGLRCRFQDDPAVNAIRQERARRIAQQLSHLPALSQQVVRLRFIEGKSLAEIAEEVDLSVDAVSKRIMRSLKKLASNGECPSSVS